jgi:hypothetical protein
MKPEHKIKWIADLRSGEYQQGKGLLCSMYNNIKKYCCLGVLLEGTLNIKPIPTAMNDLNHIIFRYDDSCHSLSNKFQQAIQLDFHDISILTNMNDQDITFNQIADYIEVNF